MQPNSRYKIFKSTIFRTSNAKKLIIIHLTLTVFLQITCELDAEIVIDAYMYICMELFVEKFNDFVL